MSSVRFFTPASTPAYTPSNLLTAWGLPELRARAKAQGETIVEAHFSRLTGWTARTAPRVPAARRTYAVSVHDALTGQHREGTVTLACVRGVWVGEVDGAACALGAALSRLETATSLRLVDEELALAFSNPLTGPVHVAARVEGAR